MVRIKSSQFWVVCDASDTCVVRLDLRFPVNRTEKTYSPQSLRIRPEKRVSSFATLLLAWSFAQSFRIYPWNISLYSSFDTEQTDFEVTVISLLWDTLQQYNLEEINWQKNLLFSNCRAQSNPWGDKTDDAQYNESTLSLPGVLRIATDQKLINADMICRYHVKWFQNLSGYLPPQIINTPPWC